MIKTCQSWTESLIIQTLEKLRGKIKFQQNVLNWSIFQVLKQPSSGDLISNKFLIFINPSHIFNVIHYLDRSSFFILNNGTMAKKTYFCAKSVVESVKVYSCHVIYTNMSNVWGGGEGEFLRGEKNIEMWIKSIPTVTQNFRFTINF